jgi:hypothetical protein
MVSGCLGERLFAFLVGTLALGESLARHPGS